jgi:D-alanine-D-alanine ligase
LPSNSDHKVRLALLFGGRSGEHEISIRSARSIREALNRDKYEVLDYFIDQSGKWDPQPFSPEPAGNRGIDVVFPALHGTFGEDGTVQGLLEMAELPYVGAGLLSSAICMDKALTKRLCRDAGLPVVDYVVLKRGATKCSPAALPFDFPVFVKPANLGSSVGISKVKCTAGLEAALETASQYDATIIIERGIQGREFECAVLDGHPIRAATPCEILPSQDFYSYEDKYLLDTARIDLPANLSPDEISAMQELAIGCFETLGCEGMARIDFLREETSGRLFINEANTIPGFTSISMYPKMWEYSGISFPELLDRLVELAFERARVRAQTRYTR